MILDRTEAFENRSWRAADAELGVDDGREFVERSEESVVEPKAAKKLPYPLDGIEFDALRGEEQQDEAGFLFEPPLAMQVAIVVFGVLDDDDDRPAGIACNAPSLAEVVPAGLGIEVPFWRGSKNFLLRMRTAPK